MWLHNCQEVLDVTYREQVAVSYTDSSAALASKPAPSKLTGGQLMAATTASFTASGAQCCTVWRTGSVPNLLLHEAFCTHGTPPFCLNSY